MEPKRIYLAGLRGIPDWRNEIVKGLNAATSEPLDEWPVLEGAILRKFDYVGPFYDPYDPTIIKPVNPDQCAMAMTKADLIFAYAFWPGEHDIATEPALMAELGFALGLKWAKRPKDQDCVDDSAMPTVAVCFFDTRPMTPQEQAVDLYICEMGMSGAGIYIPLLDPPFYFVNPEDGDYNRGFASTALGALKLCLADLGWIFDSPMEEKFWLLWRRHSGELPLLPQHEVLGGKYRLDFAHLASKTAIELDGFNYHSDRPQFERDRKRDRELGEAGWRVIRFASGELGKDMNKCVEQAVRMIKGQQGG